METRGFGKVWIWTDDPKQYGCIEPVVQAPDKFNTSEGKFLKKGEKISLKMKLSIRE